MNAADFFPQFKGGNLKWFPENISGMLGLPSVGDIFYVDPGKSVSGGGKSVDDAYKTVAEAYAAAAADNDDVIVIAGTNSTGRTTESAAVTWAKRRLHLIGNGAARQMTSRNGVGVAATDTASAFIISSNNCIFQNITFSAFLDTDVLVEVTGI